MDRLLVHDAGDPGVSVGEFVFGGQVVAVFPHGVELLNADLVARIDAQADHVATTSARLFASDEAREAMMAFLSRPKG